MLLLDDFVIWIGKKIKENAEETLYGDKDKIHEQLVALQAKLDMGQMTAEEYQREETEILERLQEMDEMNQEEDGK